MTYDDAVRWAERWVRSPVVDRRELGGGWTSTLLALSHENGRQTVLRLIDREPWRTHGAELATREHETQMLLESTDVAAPRSIALDAVGEVAGVAAHLMTLLPGEFAERSDDDALLQMADLLAAVHSFEPTTWPRDYQSWAWEAKFVVPGWARSPDAWTSAFAILRDDPPSYERTFLHRDFQPRNILWEGGRITGLVDWVETSTGPAWLDVSHCASNLALRLGVESAGRFAERYVEVTGRRGDPYWEVMDIVGFLPPPGRRVLRPDDEWWRLEELLVTILTRGV